ncbi:hypothetical protein WAI453_013623 [Rhynchosporium graminicola]
MPYPSRLRITKIYFGITTIAVGLGFAHRPSLVRQRDHLQCTLKDLKEEERKGLSATKDKLEYKKYTPGAVAWLVITFWNMKLENTAVKQEIDEIEKRLRGREGEEVIPNCAVISQMMRSKGWDK